MAPFLTGFRSTQRACPQRACLTQRACPQRVCLTQRACLTRRALLLLLAAGCHGSTGCHGTAPVAASSDEVEVHADIPYAREHAKQKLDVYVQRDARFAPIVVFVHGGYWVSGDRRAPEHGEGLYANIGTSLARRGIMTVVPSYRLGPKARATDMLDDVVRTIEWTRRHADRFGGDRERLYLMGHSAGGHLVALVALDPRWLARRGLAPDVVHGTIVASGIWDLVAMRDAQPDRFNQTVTYPIFGRDEEELRRYSPIAYTKERRAPFLIIVAEHDFAYLVPQAQRAFDALQEAGTLGTMRVVRGYDHLDVVRRFGSKGDVVAEHVAAFVSISEP